MSFFRSRRKQQEPPSSVNFNNIRRREPVDPPCTLLVEREESPPDIQLSEHQLELLKEKSRRVDTQYSSEPNPNDHEAPVLYDDENEVVVDENIVASKGVPIGKEPIERQQQQQQQQQQIKQEALASNDAQNRVMSAQQSSKQMNQRPFTTRSNQQSKTKTRTPAATSLALASLMTRKTSRSSVFKKENKSTGNQNAMTSLSSSNSVASAVTHSTDAQGVKNGSMASNGTAASEEDKAILRKMLGGTTAEKQMPSSKPTENARQPPASTSTTSSTSEDKMKTTASKEFDQSEFIRGYLMSSQRVSSKPAAANTRKNSSNAASATSLTSKSSKASSRNKPAKGATQEGNKQQTELISRKTSVVAGSDASSSSNGGGGRNKTKSASSASSSSSQNPMLHKLLKKATSRNSSPSKRTLSKSSSRSPRSDAHSSSTSDNMSGNRSDKDSRLESAAVSLSRKVLRATSKTLSPKGHGNASYKGYFRNKMGRSKAPATLSRSNPISDHIDTNLSKSLSSDTADFSKGISAKSADETVDETLDSTIDSSYNGNGKQPKTQSAAVARPGSAVAPPSTLSENSTSNSSYGPIPSARSHLGQDDTKHIVTAGTTDTEESSVIMANLPSLSTDSMQYSTEESCEDAHVLRKPQTAELQIATTHPRLHLISYDEPEGYTQFIQALRSEASGTHSQLWSSFQAVMCGSARKAPPKVTFIRFDQDTKNMLGEINNYLKKQALVECVTATQLVNDKKFAKEAAVGLALRASKGDTRHSNYIQASRGFTSSRGHTNGNLPSLRHMQPLVDGEENTPTNTRQTMTAAEALETSETSNSVEMVLDNGEGKSTETHSSQNTASDPSSKSRDAPKTTNGVKAAQGIIAVGNKRVQQLPPSPEEVPAVPWVGVRLRSVPPPTATDDAIEASSQPQEPTMPSPWAKVKLRRVSAADEDFSSESDEHSEAPGEKAFGQAAKPKTGYEHDIIVCPTNLSDLEDSSKDPGPEKVNEPGIIVRPTNLTDLEEKVEGRASEPEIIFCPSNASEESGGVTERTSEKIDESAVVFSLKKTLDCPEREQEKVVIGKNMVMMLRPQPGEPTDRAIVTWKYPRDGIKALKLDMESQSVNLSLSDGDSHSLQFNNSTDCLKFANAFYELLQPNEKKQVGSIVPSDSADSSHHLESLSHEEQEVLETYRQVRRTKPQRDAMRAIVPESVPLLNNAEIKVAETYRKMLKDSVPLNDVRARMQLDGVSVAVENFILSSVQEKKEASSETVPKESQTDLPLSEEDMRIAESYQKMIRLKIPPDAVQHKMTKEGVDPKIMGFVLGQAGILTTDTNYAEDLSESERKIATLYRNMLKLMVPLDNVREKMKEDNIDEKIVFAVLGRDKVEKSTLQDTATKLTEAEEAIAASYRKMLKMMIPKEAVRHKMIKDQVDPKIMVVVVGGGKPVENEKIELSEKEEEIAAAYRKMLKLQIPKEAVLHRMEKEGVSERIKKAVIGSCSGTSDKPSKSNAKKDGPSNKNGSKLVSLHWTPLSGEELDNSVWRASKKRKVTKAQPEGSDISKLVELFQKKNTSKAVKGKGTETGNGGTGKAKLLDINRANNVAISLKAFKDFSHDELADILKNIDPNGKLRGERVQFVRDLLPTPAEINVIRRYYGSPDRLVPAEIWFQKIAHIKRLESKAHVLHTMEVFDMEVAELRENLQLLAQVCQQVMESERLRELLDMVLQIGNIMNEGTRTGGAAGFKFDSLLRLTQTKSGDGRTTVLDYMVTIFAAKGQRQVLNLIEDFPECQAASRVMITDLVANVRAVGDTLQKCKKEYEALSSEATGKVTNTAGIFQGKSTKGNLETASDTKLQLLSAIKSRGVQELRKAHSEVPDRDSIGCAKNNILDAIKSRSTSASEESPATGAPTVGDLLKAVGTVTNSTEGDKKSPRSSLLASQNAHHERKNNKSSNTDTTDEAIHPSALQKGIARLEKFIKEAEKNYDVLKSDCDSALATCQEMSKYCGESGGERATDTLLGILSEFASNLEAAVKKHDRTVATESKKQSKQAATTPSKQRRRPEDHRGGQPSPKSKNEQNDTKKPSTKTKSSPKSRPSPESRPLLPPAPAGKNGKSLVLMVNQLLKDADEKTKADFSKGVVYENADNTLKEIYEREKRVMARTGMPPLPTGRRSVDGDILTTIKKRQGETDASVAREARSQLERVIGSMNCTAPCQSSVTDSDMDSVKTESSQLEDSFKDLQSKWSLYKGQNKAPTTSTETIASSKEAEHNDDDDEGSVNLPIDCTDFENEASVEQSQPSGVLNTIVAFETAMYKEDKPESPVHSSVE